METVREVRDEIERQVETLFDELEQLADEKRASADSSGGVITAIRDSLSSDSRITGRTRINYFTALSYQPLEGNRV